MVFKLSVVSGSGYREFFIFRKFDSHKPVLGSYIGDKGGEDMTRAEMVMQLLDQSQTTRKQIREIRLRVGRPVLIYEGKTETQWNVTVDRDLIREFLGMVSSHSLYAFEDEIRQGFLTIEGGHRIGITGTVVQDGKEIRTIKDISGLNIRVAHACPGCADRLLPWICERDQVFNTLLISPPGAGKTTMLRELIRQISEGDQMRKGLSVSVVDERSELAACYRGVPQWDLGSRTDVLDGCPKALGMNLMIRSMAPRVLAVDEIGTQEDLEALREVMKCGCKVLATVHGTCVEDLKKKRILKDMVIEEMFERYVVLTGNPIPGTIAGIYGGAGQKLR